MVRSRGRIGTSKTLSSKAVVAKTNRSIHVSISRKTTSYKCKRDKKKKEGTRVQLCFDSVGISNAVGCKYRNATASAGKCKPEVQGREVPVNS